MCGGVRWRIASGRCGGARCRIADGTCGGTRVWLSQLKARYVLYPLGHVIAFSRVRTVSVLYTLRVCARFCAGSYYLTWCTVPTWYTVDIWGGGGLSSVDVGRRHRACFFLFPPLPRLCASLWSVFSSSALLFRLFRSCSSPSLSLRTFIYLSSRVSISSGCAFHPVLTSRISFSLGRAFSLSLASRISTSFDIAASGLTAAHHHVSLCNLCWRVHLFLSRGTFVLRCAFPSPSILRVSLFCSDRAAASLSYHIFLQRGSYHHWILCGAKLLVHTLPTAVVFFVCNSLPCESFSLFPVSGGGRRLFLVRTTLCDRPSVVVEASYSSWWVLELPLFRTASCGLVPFRGLRSFSSRGASSSPVRPFLLLSPGALLSPAGQPALGEVVTCASPLQRPLGSRVAFTILGSAHPTKSAVFGSSP